MSNQNRGGIYPRLPQNHQGIIHRIIVNPSLWAGSAPIDDASRAAENAGSMLAVEPRQRREFVKNFDRVRRGSRFDIVRSWPLIKRLASPC